MKQFVIISAALLMLGATLTAHRSGWIAPLPGRSRQLTIGWCAATIGALAAMAVALQPSAPRFDLYVQFTPERSFWDTFAGRLLSAGLEGQPVTSGPMDASDARLRALRVGRYATEIAVSDVRPTDRFSPVLRIGNRRGEMFFLGQRHLDAVFRPRLRASDAGLRSPFFAVRDGLATEGAPVRGRGEMTRGSVRLQVMTGATMEERRIELSPSLGWALLLPVEVALAGSELLFGAFWLALLSAPAGYWTGLWLAAPSLGRARSALRACIAPMLITGGLAAAARLSGSDGVHGEELGGILVGHLLGVATAALVRRRRNGGLNQSRSARPAA